MNVVVKKYDSLQKMSEKKFKKFNKFNLTYKAFENTFN